MSRLVDRLWTLLDDGYASYSPSVLSLEVEERRERESVGTPPRGHVSLEGEARRGSEILCMPRDDLFKIHEVFLVESSVNV